MNARICFNSGVTVTPVADVATNAYVSSYLEQYTKTDPCVPVVAGAEVLYASAVTLISAAAMLYWYILNNS